LRLATFSLRSSPQLQRVGALRGDRLVEVDAPSMKALLARGPGALRDLAARVDRLPGAGHALADVVFHPPVTDAS